MSNTPSGLPATDERVVVVLESADLDASNPGHRSLRLIAALVESGTALTVVTCTRPDANIAARHEFALSSVGVHDHRFLGGSGARMTDLAPRVYVAPDGDIQSLATAVVGEVAADIATVIATSGARAVLLLDDKSDQATSSLGGPTDADIRTTPLAAARRAAEVLAVPLFLSNDTSLDRLESESGHLRGHDILAVGGHSFVRDGSTRDHRMSGWRDQGIGTRIAAVVAAVLIGVVTGALGTVTQAWTVSLAGVTVPLGLIGALIVTTCLLAGLRLAFSTRTMAIGAAVGLIGIVAILSTKSTGGSVLMPAVTASYYWVYGPVFIALLVLAWPHIDRVRAQAPPGS